MLVYELKAPDIDRLLDRFQPEWKKLFFELDRSDRKQIRVYLNYRKNPNSEWSFMLSTAQTVERVNEKAKKLYWEKIRYTQLTIFDYLKKA